jgi:hypothetical protein
MAKEIKAALAAEDKILMEQLLAGGNRAQICGSAASCFASGKREITNRYSGIFGD